MLRLADALEALTTLRIENATAVITEAAIDSRQVIPGSLFVCIPGEQVDGHNFIGEAFRRRASFALIQRDAGLARRLFDKPGINRLCSRSHSASLFARG
jgi:UDP-N-acetylmuramoyl-tripeptide--D-alanyl-D-alanine ligase